MAGIGRVTVSNVAAVGDVTQTRQWKITVVFDIAFNYGGYNLSGASYSITCDGQKQSGTATFNIANGGGSYVWGNIATKTFTVTLPASVGTKTVGISATINTGVNPATITASNSCTLNNKYTVTFDPNGGTLPNPGGNLYNGTNTDSVTVTYHVAGYGRMLDDIPTRAGYTFTGWYTSASGGEQVYDSTGMCITGTYWDSDRKWLQKSDLTVYAHWTANTYTVSYDANGGSNAPNAQTKVYGVNLTLSGVTPARKHYKFLYWNTKSDGTGTIYYPGVSFPENTNLALYAIWKKQDDVRVKTENNYKRGRATVKVAGVYKTGRVRIKVNGAWRKGD